MSSDLGQILLHRRHIGRRNRDGPCNALDRLQHIGFKRVHHLGAEAALAADGGVSSSGVA